MRPLTKDVSLRHDNGLWSVVAGHYVYAENLTFDDAMLERKRLINQWIDTCSRSELEEVARHFLLGERYCEDNQFDSASCCS